MSNLQTLEFKINGTKFERTQRLLRNETCEAGLNNTLSHDPDLEVLSYNEHITHAMAAKFEAVILLTA